MSAVACSTRKGRSGTGASPTADKNSRATTTTTQIDLRNVINIGRDAHNVIISRKKKREEIEAYNPSSNHRIPPHISGSFKKRKQASTPSQGKSHA